jgi:hypothetical protein
MAETAGFEPAKGYNTLNDLANRRFQPLSHVSISSINDNASVETTASKDARFILAGRRTLSSFKASYRPNQLHLIVTFA